MAVNKNVNYLVNCLSHVYIYIFFKYCNVKNNEVVATGPPD